MSTTVFSGGTIRRLPGGACADWISVDAGVVVGIGRGDAPTGDRSVDLDGGVLIPAFCDAHVHLPATGLFGSGLDVRGESSARVILDGLAGLAAEIEGVVIGSGFEDPLDEPITRLDLDRATGSRLVLLARADMHSCIVSTALLDELEVEGLEGVDRDADGRPTGFLREKAASQAWSWLDRQLSPEQQTQAIQTAVKTAYSKGVASVHEMFVVEWRGWPSLDVFLNAISNVALKVFTYCGTDEVKRVKEMGFPRIGGDFFLDGAFGSHTAWLSQPYATAPPEGTPEIGISYRSTEDLFDYFMEGQAEGLQVGVHAIGDAAIEQAISTWERVAAKVGVEQVRNLGHRIEHFECSSDDQLRRAARLRLRASVQPAFDSFWGGPDGFYSNRIGWERAAEMNRFGSMVNAGLLVGAGSDSTVTPLDPFLQIAALREHHLATERLGKLEALRLHVGGARALAEGPGLAGTVEVGAPADLAWLDRDPAEVDPAELRKTEVLGTWVDGVRVWPEAEAEVG